MEIIPVNKYQTPITQELLDSLPSEVAEQLLDYVNNVPFIKSLINPDRPRAKDLPRDSKGRILVDITNPHILEDMDYFREAAIHYEKHNCYTFLRPNPNPNSEFGKWFKTELERIWEGMVRPEDGEWVSGEMYYFLNYCPIMLSKVDPNNPKIANRVEGFPEVWEGIYFRYHYLNQARYGGIHNNFEGGNHGAELAKRGCGKSFSLASMMARRLIAGENKESKTRVSTILVAYLREYLAEKDGTISKFLPMIDHVALTTQFPRARLKDALRDMTWQMGYKDVNTGINKGTLNTVMGVPIKDGIGKLRGKRGFIYVEEYGSFPNLLKVYATIRPSVEEGNVAFGMIYLVGCVCKDTLLYKPNGLPIKVQDIKLGDSILGNNGCPSEEEVTYIQEPAFKECVEIKAEKNTILKCSTDHPLLVKIGNKCTFIKAGNLTTSHSLVIPKYTSGFGDIKCPHAYLLGTMFGDGSFSKCSCPSLSITTEEQYEYFNTHYDIGISKLRSSSTGIYAQIYFRGIKNIFEQYGMWNTSKENKAFPNSIFDWDKQSISEFLAGYFDADGNVQIVKGRYRTIKLTCKYEHPLILTESLLGKFGISAHIYKEFKRGGVLKSSVNNKESAVKDGTYYVLYISNNEDILTFRENIHLKILSKKDRLDSYFPTIQKGLYNLDFIKTGDKGDKLIGKTFKEVKTVRIKSISNIGVQRVYNLTANTTNTYLSNKLISSNTSGDSESDFEAAKELMYHPKGYNIYAVPNVYDKPAQGNPHFCYFFAGYLNRKGFYNKDGVSDVVGAIIEILQNRFSVKYHSSDPNAIIKAIAEVPITPQEAILRTTSSIFPINDINQRIAQIDQDPSFYNDVYTGDLVFKDNKIEYFPSYKQPIRDYPHKDANKEGCWEIYSMPERDSSDKIFPNRYIISYDPYDNDHSEESTSLGSLFVLDLWTDNIVAEYTGRPPLVDLMHEECRKACIFYNARCLYENNKKGCYAYFLKMNSLHLLADTPEYLKDKQLIKSLGSGNTSKGVNASGSINNYARTLLSNWLMSPVTSVEIINDEEVQTSIPKVYHLKGRAALKELSLWNPNANFDRVSSLGLLMLYREEKMILTQGNPRGQEVYDRDYLGNDKFFNKNYNKKNKSTLLL